MLKKPSFLPLLFFVFIFAIYLLGISKSVYGGDSGDVILAAFFGGVAHPPGYPLNSIFGYIFTHLPIAASVAYKANIMMALFSAGTIFLLFLIIKRLFNNLFIALSSALVLAFSPLFWLYAHVTEVFQLNVFLVAVSVYFLILWHNRSIQSKRYRRNADRFLLVSVFFLGMAVFHHQTAVLLLPAYLYFVYKYKKKLFGFSKQSLYLALVFLAGAVPYVLVPFLAARHTPINWDDASNFQNFIRLITRADYGSFVASQQFIGTGYKARLLQVVSYFAFIKNDFTLVGSFLILLGVIYTFLKQRIIFWFLFWAVFFTGPFFLFYSSFSLSSDFLFGIWERFILLSYFFLDIFLAYGIYFLYLKAGQINFKKRAFPIRREVLLTILALSFLLLPLYMVRNNWQKADMSGFELGDWLGHDILASSAPDSLIFLFDDTAAFDTQYIYYTSRDYGDRTIILSGILRHIYYREQVSREFPGLSLPADFLSEGDFQSDHYVSGLIEANKDKIPVYSVDSNYKVSGYSWVASGLLWRLVKDPDASNKEYVKSLNDTVIRVFDLNVDDAALGYGNFIPESIKRFYAFSFNDIGDQMLKLNSFEDARRYYNLALVIQPQNARSLFGIGKASLELSDCSGAKHFLLMSYDLDSQNTNVLTILADEARRCEQNEQLAKQYEDDAMRITRSRMDRL